MHFKVLGHEEFYSEVTRARWNRFLGLNYNSIRSEAFRGPMTSGDKSDGARESHDSWGKTEQFSQVQLRL